MAFDFSALPGDSKRAAFAKMDRSGKGRKSSGLKSAGSKPGSAAKKFRDVGKINDGKNTTYGTSGGGQITREQAAEMMFGSSGARARIAKYNRQRKK